MSISLSNPSIINELTENSILRCPKCKLIPSITSNIQKNIIEYNCPNKHYDKGDFNSIYNKLKIGNNILNIKCVKCSKFANFYCSKCENFYCEKDKKIDEIKENHFLVLIKNIDNFCFKNNSLLANFCKNDEICLCPLCEHNFEHEIVPLQKLLIKNEKLDFFEKKLDEIKNIFNTNEIKFNLKILNELEKILNFYLNQIKNIKNQFNNNKSNNYYLFFKDLINSYKFKINNNCINYNIINNLTNNFNQNFILNSNEKILSNLFEELIIKLQKLEKKYSEMKNNFLNEEFNIKKTKFINEINYIDCIYCLKVTNDKRILIGGKSSILFVLNNNFNIDLKIDNKKNNLNFIEQIKNKNNNFILCFENEIRIIKIINKNFYILQEIKNAHNNQIYNSIVLNNNNFISCSADQFLKIWNFSENKFKMDFYIKENFPIFNVLEFNNNQIVYYFSQNKNSFLKFFDLNEKKEIKIFDNLFIENKNGNRIEKFNENILIAGINKIYIFETKNFIKINEINVNFSTLSLLKINDIMILFGDSKGNIIQFDYVNNKIIDVKNNIHQNGICALAVFNDYLISAEIGKIAKVWK